MINQLHQNDLKQIATQLDLPVERFAYLLQSANHAYEFIKKMGGGLPILDTITKKCEVTKLNDYSFKIVLTQGLNRQIRRMCDYLNYEVTSLKRTRIMNVNLDDLKVGEWRELSETEMLQNQQNDFRFLQNRRSFSGWP